jgi:uncharacterized protein YkwD
MTHTDQEANIYNTSLLFRIFLLLLTVVLQTNTTYALDANKSLSYETELLHQINLYRTENGLNALTSDRTLIRLARVHSRYMKEKDVLSHDNFENRFRQCRRSSCVENVGWNSSTPRAQLLAWESSKGHNANLLNRKIRSAGIAKVGAYVTFFACD